MYLRFHTLLFFIFIHQSLFSQTAQNVGYAHDLLQLPTQVSLRAYTPPVGQQSNNNTCVAWAIGYGAMSMQKAKALNLTQPEQIKRIAFSAAFIYNQIAEGDCKTQLTLQAGMDLVQQKGNLPYAAFDDKNKSCWQQPNAAQLKRAIRNKLPITLLFSKTDAAKGKILATQLALSKGVPVIVSLRIRRNFYALFGAQYWWPKIGNTSAAGNHALVVVAYDDKKQAFLLMNSWGEKWGKDGFIWIKYQDYARFARTAYVLVTNEMLLE